MGWSVERRKEAGVPYRFVSPEGELVEGVGLRVFCEENGLRVKKVEDLRRGVLGSYHGWTLHPTDPNYKAPRERKEKAVGEAKSPYPAVIIRGVRFEGILNLKEFCLQHDLNYSTLSTYIRMRKTEAYQHVKLDYSGM